MIADESATALSARYSWRCDAIDGKESRSCRRIDAKNYAAVCKLPLARLDDTTRHPIMNIKLFFSLAKKAVNAWIDDYAPSMGAAIAFYTVFSLAPLVIIVLAVAGFFWGAEAVQGELFGQIRGLVGADGASAVQGIIQGASEPTKGIIATAISVVVLAVGSTTVFAELQSALDRIWHVPEAKKKSGLWNTLRSRLLSFGLVLGLAFLLIVSLVVSTVLTAISAWTVGRIPGWEIMLQIVNIVVTFGVLTLLFAMIYKFMPQAHVAWRDVWVGALLTALLFEIGKYLIGLYMAQASVTSSYAAAGSLVALLIWVYYAAQIFLLGAEFTWVYASEHGSLAKAKAAATPRAVSQERAQLNKKLGRLGASFVPSGTELPEKKSASKHAMAVASRREIWLFGAGSVLTWLALRATRRK